MKWLPSIGLVVLLAIGILLVMFGGGQRGFFSPDTLETKTQNEVLLFRELPVFRSSYTRGRYKLVDYLIEEGYWRPLETEHPRWMGTFHSNVRWRDGYSHIHRELSWKASWWREWTEENREIAGVLWPAVLATLRADEDTYEAASVAEDLMLLVRARMPSTVEDFLAEVEGDQYLPERVKSRVQACANENSGL
jgi:hypothetical protein